MLLQQQHIIYFLKSLPGFHPNFLDTLPSFKSFPSATGNESLFLEDYLKLRSTHALAEVDVDVMADVLQFMQICRNKFKRFLFFPLH